MPERESKSKKDTDRAGATPLEVPYGSNAIRLTIRQWIAVFGILMLLTVAAPATWEHMEAFEAGSDYRIPQELNADYWQFSRYTSRVADENAAYVLGDSVVWGQYVRSDGTLSHFLNEETGKNHFRNAGVNGMHPAPLPGLLQYYGGAIRNKDVILHCNLLWMSSPERDLRIEKDISFNHPKLVAQFSPRIPCYNETLSNRIGICIQRGIPAFGLISHLRIAYFRNMDIPSWTLEHPYRNPCSAVTFSLPTTVETLRADAVPWTEKGIAEEDIPWVDLERSLQWASFRRAVDVLKRRGNRVFIVVGPFNEYMLTEASRHRYRALEQEVVRWLVGEELPYIVPDLLPREQYADASHPLREGYQTLARRLVQSDRFRQFAQPGALQRRRSQL